jgi:hypothetical protein
MKPIELKIDEYHILVIETQDNHIIEWSGNLTLIPLENGETFVDISFSDEEIYRNLQDRSLDPDIAELSIELMDCEILPEVEAISS